MIRVAYMAHQLGKGRDRAENIANARKWGVWLARNYEVSVVADWIWLAQELEETESNRALGMRCDLALVERCDDFFLCGGRVSTGMQEELDHYINTHKPSVRYISDLTHLGKLPPARNAK